MCELKKKERKERRIGRMFRIGDLGESVGKRDEMGLAAWLKDCGWWPAQRMEINGRRRSTSEGGGGRRVPSGLGVCLRRGGVSTWLA